MVRIRTAIFLGAMVLLFASCGPEQSTRDKETEQINENFAQRKADYDSISGNYSGTMKAIDGSTNIRVEVLIRTFIEMIPAPNRVDYIPLPTLVGNLRPATSDNFAWPFTKGYYDATDGTLKMSGSNESDFIFMDLKVVGRKLVGTITRGRYFSAIELTRTK